MCANNYWSNSDAAVACRQLRYSATGAKALRLHLYWHYGRIYFDSAHCHGSETKLINCIRLREFTALLSYRCQDAGVSCFPRSSKLEGIAKYNAQFPVSTV